MLRLFISLLLIISCWLSVDAQMLFRQLDTTMGLPDNEIKGQVWLPNGRLCVRTSSSLSLFDGCTFRSVPPMEDENYYTDYVASISTLYVDAQQRVWIKEPGKFLIFDVSTESYVKDIKSLFASMGIKEKVVDFFIDEAKEYWFVTASGKVLSLKASVNREDIPKAKEQRVRGKGLRGVCRRGNQHWFVYSNGIVAEWDANMRNILSSSLVWKGEVPARDFIQFAQNKKFLWVMWNHGVATYHDAIHRWQNRYVNPTDMLVSLCVASNNQVYVSLRHVGFLTLDSKGGSWLQTELKNTNGETVMDDIQSITSCHDNMILGLAGKGILFYHPNMRQFPFLSLQGMGLDASGYRMNDMIDGSGLLTRPDAVYRLNTKAGTLIRLPLQGTDMIRSMEDSKGRIWAGSFRQGLFMWDGVRTHRILQGGIPNQDINYEIVRGFIEDHHHNIWVSFQGGIGKMDEQKMRFIPLRNPLLARYKVVNEFHVDKKDNIWVASSQGLFVYSQSTKKVLLPKDLVSEPMAQRQLDAPCKALLIDRQGYVWVGTLNGIFVINPKDKSVCHLGKQDGMPNEMINGMLEDKLGNVWATTPNGLCRFQRVGKQDYKLMVFDSQNKLTNSQFGWMTNAHGIGGKLFFGTAEGFYVINPTEVKSMKYSGHPIFTSLLVNNQEIIPGKEYNGRVLLKKALASTNRVVLKYNENFITINFSGLNFDMPTHTYYKYRLKGVNADWVEISPQDGEGKANYTNLSPGTYEFEVYSAGFDKIWSKQSIKLEIIVEPPFWATWWARTLYVLIFVAILVLGFSWKLEQNRQRMEVERDKELEEMKYRFFTNISHEFRTLLTLIITPIGSILRKTTDAEVREQLSGVSKNAGDLLQLVNQLLDFRKMEMDGERLNLASGNLNEFIRYTTMKFTPLSEQKNVRLTFEDRSNGLFMYFDRDKVGKILTNLLSNAFKFTKEGGSVSVSLEKRIIDSRRYAHIVVADTGCGISKKEQPHVFERFYRAEQDPASAQVGSGIGLNMVYEYIKLHQGKVSLESEVGKGSHFIVDIPTDLKHAMMQEKASLESSSEIQSSADSAVEIKTVESGTQTTPKMEKTILVVEDNDDFRQFLVRELGHIYNKVLFAKDGIEGVMVAEVESPDIVVSDVMMPRMNGTDLCRRIKENLETSHIPVVLLTAWSTDEGRTEGYKAGADAYIAKPFDMEVLLARIDNLLEKQEKRQRDFSHSISLDPKNVTDSSPDEDFLKEVIACIEKNIDNSEYTIDSLAADVVMSRMSLYRKMKALTGQTPADFIRTVRLKSAASLLKTGKYNVSEVCYRTGFASPQNFTKHFKDMFGTLPSQYC